MKTKKVVKKKATHPRVVLTVDQRLRKILDKIDEALFTPNNEGSDDHNLALKLWDVLTALRGPDNPGDYTKDSTTGVIRRKALPKTFQYGWMSSNSVIPHKRATSSRDCPYYAQRRAEGRTETNGGVHFSNHAKKAFGALGLRWTEDNDKA